MNRTTRRTTTPLDREAIVAAGLRVVDRAGPGGFSIRAVATELGVAPMSLYYHVADRNELVVAMMEAVYAEAPLADQPIDDWRKELLAIASWFHGAFVRHPHLATVARDVGTTPTMFRMGERWFDAWRRSGLSADAAQDAGTSSASTMTVLVREAALDARLYDLTVRSLVEGLFAELRRP